MKSKSFIILLAVLVCLGAAVVLWRQFSHPAIDFRSSHSAGEVMASELGRLLGGGGQVVLIRPQHLPDAISENVTSFTAALQHGNKLKLAATITVPRPAGLIMAQGGLTPEQFMAAMDENPEANALVVFTELPPYSSVLAGKVKGRSLTVVAACGYDGNVRRWIESQAVALAVIPRMDTPAPHTTHSAFESEYQLVTPENVASLPY